MSGTISLRGKTKKIKKMAKQRHEIKKGRSYYKQLGDIEFNPHLLGLLGELTFSIITGLPIDEKLKRNGDGGVDFIYQGVPINVKTTRWKSGLPMLEFEKKYNNFDGVYVYIMVDEERKKGRIIGWIDRDEMPWVWGWKDFGFGERIFVRRKDLHKWNGKVRRFYKHKR